MSIWQKRTARIPLQNVSMATNQLNENKGGISAGCAYFLVRNYCAPSPKQDDQIDVAAFEKVCDETLDSLTEYFEEIVEAAAHLDGADVTYGVRKLSVCQLNVVSKTLFDFRVVFLLLHLENRTALT